MRQRCNDKRKDNYRWYGGRGIKVCERWDLFDNFISDMKSRPTDLHRIERQDNNGPYSPDNCIWVEVYKQSLNRRSNRPITFQNRTMLAHEWAKELGVNTSTIRTRLCRGWSIEKVLQPTFTYWSRCKLATIESGHRTSSGNQTKEDNHCPQQH